jgi:hypothetical protein
MADHQHVVDPVTQLELRVPAGIWPEQAIEHARRGRDGELRGIRFGLDWGHDYPLWEPGSELYTLVPDDLRLSRDLGARLHAWAATWFVHCSPEHGWDSEERHRTWVDAGHRLADELELELYDVAQVTREFS